MSWVDNYNKAEKDKTLPKQQQLKAIEKEDYELKCFKHEKKVRPNKSRFRSRA